MMATSNTISISTSSTSLLTITTLLDTFSLNHL